MRIIIEVGASEQTAWSQMPVTVRTTGAEAPAAVVSPTEDLSALAARGDLPTHDAGQAPALHRSPGAYTTVWQTAEMSMPYTAPAPSSVETQADTPGGPAAQ